MVEAVPAGIAEVQIIHTIWTSHIPCAVWVPPKSMLPCFKHNQINSAKVHPIRTRSQGPLQQASLLQTQSNQLCKGAPNTNPIAGFFFIMWKILLCDISGITTKAPCEAARMSVRHARIEISDFALRTFVPFFGITQYLPRYLVEKRFLSLLFSKKINQSIFPLNW